MNNNFFIVEQNGKYRLVELKNHHSLPIIYNIQRISSNNIFLLSLDDGNIIYDAEYRKVIAKLNSGKVDYSILKNLNTSLLLDISKGYKEAAIIDTKKYSIEAIIGLEKELVMIVKNKETNIYSWINQNGEHIKNEECTRVYNINKTDRYIILEKDSTFSISNSKEEYEIPIRNIELLNDSLILLKDNNKYGLYDFKKQKMLLPIYYDFISIEVNTDDTIILVKKDKYYGIFNIDLKEFIIPIQDKYERIERVSLYDNLFVATKLKSHDNIIDIFNFKEKLFSGCFDKFYYLDENMFLVTKDRKRYLLSLNGEKKMKEVSYIRVDKFVNGYAGIYDASGNVNLINMEWKEVLPSGIYSYITNFDIDGYAIVCQYDEYSNIIDKNITKQFQDNYYRIIEKINNCNKEGVFSYKGNKYNYIPGILVKEGDKFVDYPSSTSAIKFLNVGSRNDVLTVYKIKDDYLFFTGCFNGNLESFNKSVERTHGNNRYGREYKEIIEYVKKIEF